MPTAPSSIAQGPTLAGPPAVAVPPFSLTAVSLSGTVFEMTETRPAPVEGVDVYCERLRPGWAHVGLHRPEWFLRLFRGYRCRAGVLLSASGVTPLYVSKDGYRVVGAISTLPDGSGRRDVTITGNTTFDIQIERR